MYNIRVPRAAILLASATDRELRQGPKVGSPRFTDFRLSVQPQKFETIAVTIGYKNGQLLRLRVILAPARAHDPWRCGFREVFDKQVLFWGLNHSVPAFRSARDIFFRPKVSFFLRLNFRPRDPILIFTRPLEKFFLIFVFPFFSKRREKNR